jgi:histidinol-phosphate aminotransferase
MLDRISKNAQNDALERGFSRRQLGRMAGMVVAGVPLLNEAALSRSAIGMTRGIAMDMISSWPADAVRLDLNENPLGPCEEAVQAVAAIARFGHRYEPRHEHQDLINAVAEMEGLKRNYISVGIGSSQPLVAASCAFTSPTRSLVTGNPAYEFAGMVAERLGVKVHSIPLRESDHAHDVKAMLRADSKAGLYYIVSPNNPTGTVTPFEDIEYLLGNKPKGSVLLLDEAYIQFAAERSPAVDLVAADKDIVVLRTFSKLYGMAGLRMGLAYGRPDLLEKMEAWFDNAVPVTGIAAATASLKVKDLRTTRRKINKEARENTLEFLEAKNFTIIKGPQCNNFMIDVKRPGMDFIQALAKKKVMICQRMFPIYPNHVRVSVGTQDEMNRFKKAFLEVMA